MESDKLIDILKNEINNRRTEINLLVKDINYCMFSFIGSLALFTGLYLKIASSKIPGSSPDLYISILAFSISQIEFIVITLAQSLLSGIMTGAAHISSIENKINSLSNNHLLYWESKIS